MKGFFSSSLPVLSHPMDLVPKCGDCGLYKTCESPKMKPSGKGRKNILVVAEAPGEDEDKHNTQLIGNSGQRIMKEFRKNGIDMRVDCTLTNALICRPQKNQISKGKDYIGFCRPNLLNTIAKLKPEKIILLGTTAVESLLKHLWRDNDIGGIMRWAGYQIPCQSLNAWVCPIFHPSFLLHSQDDPVLEVLFSKHLEAACQLKGRPWKEVPDYESQVELVMNPKEIARRISLFNRDHTSIAFDYETTCLKPDGPHAEIYTCSISNGKQTIAFPWGNHLVLNAMEQLLTNPKVKKIGSNNKFEDRWTRVHLGVAVKGWFIDTMLTAHALENASKTRKISSIKFQAFVHLGQQIWSTKIEPFLKTAKGSSGNEPNRIRQAPLRELLIYNGLDSLLEFEVAKKQHYKIKED